MEANKVPVINRVFISGVEYDPKKGFTPHRFNIAVIARVPGTDDGYIHEVGRVSIPKRLRPLVAEDLQEYVSRVIAVSSQGLSKSKTLKYPKFLEFDDSYSIADCVMDYLGGMNDGEED